MLKMFFLVANPVTSWFNNQIHRFLLWLDQSVYWFAAQCYQLFMKLSTAQIFTDDFFSSFAKRIYAILGVFMLFYLVYALLNAIVDPDKLTNDKGAGKIAVNLIISLTLLGLLPNIFDLAYRLQNFVLSSNLLGAVILGSDVVDVSDSESVKENNESLIRFGDYASFTVLNSFLNPENVNPTLDNGYNWYGVKKEILKEGKWKNLPLLSDAVSNGASIGGENVVLTYRPIVSTAAGIFLIYILLSFTLDLGVRVVKFAFYQLLAPIPIVLRIIPSKKGTFDKWLKQTLSVYFEVFVRVGLMYIAIYFINAITSNSVVISDWIENGGAQGKLALAIIIMGVFAFAKQAPKIISDVLGIDTGGIKLGLGEKLKAGGFFGAGAAVGSLITSGFNPFAAVRGWKAGNKDGNFQQIGREAILRRKVLQARAEGSTWIGRRVNDVRGYFGYDTTVDSSDRIIERNKYNGLTYNGQPVTKELLETNKGRLKAEYDPIEAKRSSTQTILDKLKTAVERDSYSKKDAAGQVIAQRVSGAGLAYGDITGKNYSELKKRIDELNDAYRPDAANYTTTKTDAAGRNYKELNKEAYQADFKLHQETMSKYYAKLNDVKDAMMNDLYQGILKNTPGHVNDADVFNAIELSKQNHDSLSADLEMLKRTRNTERDAANELNREIARIEAVEKQAEANVNAAKREHYYQSQQADKNSRSK